MSILRVVWLRVFLLITTASYAFAAKGTSDHLVPLNQYSTPEYRRLYEKKLFITRGDIARFVYLPGAVDPEMVVSVYRQGAGSHEHPTRYWITVTKPSARLWLCIHTGDEKFTGRKDLDPSTVLTSRADASLPESTAVAIHRLWTAALEKTAADPCVDCFGRRLHNYFLHRRCPRKTAAGATTRLAKQQRASSGRFGFSISRLYQKHCGASALYREENRANCRHATKSPDAAVN